MLTYCPGALDAYIPQLLALLVARIRSSDLRVQQGQGQAMRAYCRTELMKMAAICLYYNPQVLFRLYSGSFKALFRLH